MTRALLAFGWMLVLVRPSICAAAPPITAIAIAPDGASMVVGSQSEVDVLSYPALERQRSLSTKLPNVHDLEFSPDGKTLAVVGGIPAETGEVELFSWPDGELLQRHEPHGDLIFDIAWSHDGKQWATASLDRSVHHQGVKTRRLEGHSQGVSSVAFLSDTRYLVSAGIDNSLRLWDLETGRLRRTLDNHKAPIVDLAVRPAHDGLPMVASASEDKTVRLWQPSIGRLMRFAQLPSEPLAIAWTPDGTRLCASCRDGHVRVIDPDTVKIIADLPAIDGWAYSLAVLPDGNHVVTGGERGQIKIVSLKREK